MVLHSLRKSVDFYKQKLDSITNVNTQQLELLKGLPFYNWDKPKDQQRGTFVGTVGLPTKKGVTHGFYDYEQQIIDFMETDQPTDPKNKHLYILKSSGLGITTLLLYYIGWKCTTNNDWSNSRVCILTAPRLDLTIDLIDRFKGIFTKGDLPLLQFDSRNTICNINNVKIEAFPSHLGLKGMRGLTDIKMIVCDEASFFDTSQINEARDTIERYWSKSNPIIVLCSTPNRPDDLMDLIRMEPEDNCIYNRMYLDYSVGLDKIYTQEEIALQRLSPSFEREYNLKFAGIQGNVFHTKDIDAAIEKGRLLALHRANNYTQKSVGLDPGFGSSAFGVCITELIDGHVNVLHAEEYPRPDFNQMISTTVRLLEEYGITFEGRSRIFVDGANPSFCRALKERLDEDINYEQLVSYLKKQYSSVYDLEFLQQNMFVIPVHFSKYHKEMLAHTKEMLEYRNGYVAINPKHTKLITALRTAVENGEGMLDKEATSHDDLFDAFRLSLQFWH